MVGKFWKKYEIYRKIRQISLTFINLVIFLESPKMKSFGPFTVCYIHSVQLKKELLENVFKEAGIPAESISVAVLFCQSRGIELTEPVGAWVHLLKPISDLEIALSRQYTILHPIATRLTPHNPVALKGKGRIWKFWNWWPYFALLDQFSQQFSVVLFGLPTGLPNIYQYRPEVKLHVMPFYYFYSTMSPESVSGYQTFASMLPKHSGLATF